MRFQWWKIVILSLFTFIISVSAKAEPIQADNTLQTNIDGDLINNEFDINGGQKVGTNLFHSFSQFSLPTDGLAIFNINPANDVKNIFARVTGNSPSLIDGTIEVFNSSANLYLLNPNGIIFGQNARLDIDGSFFASTAESILFADGTQFSAVNPSNSALLTVSVPTSLQFGANPNGITVRGDGTNSSLAVDSGKTLSLVGGDVTVEGGELFAGSGRIEVGGVGSQSTVGIDANSHSPDYTGVSNFQDVSLTEAAKIRVSGTGRGQIRIQGRNVAIADGSRLINFTNGTSSEGTIEINASESLTLRGANSSGVSSRIQSETVVGSTNSGASGNIAIATPQLTLQEGTRISSRTFTSGNSGNIAIDADRVAISGTSPNGDLGGLFAATDSSGNAGNITLSSSQIDVGDNALISTITEGSGRGGQIEVESDRLSLTGGAQLLTGTRDSGQSGNLQVRADIIELSGTGISSSGLSTQVDDIDAVGNSGDLDIETRQLFVRGGAQISASTFGKGNGGTARINASESVEVTGTGFTVLRGQVFSGIATQVNENASGRGGDLAIATARLSVDSGGAISAGTLGEGEGGNLSIDASESVTIRASKGEFTSGISARTRSAANAGSLSIQTQTLTIADGASATVESLATGDAGELDISAHLIDMNRGTITAETLSGEGGNVRISSSDIRLRNESFISSRTRGSGNAGNLSLNTQTLAIASESRTTVESLGTGDAGKLDISASAIALDRGTITAETVSGEGGNVSISGSDIRLRNESLISSRTRGSGNAGNLSLNTQTLAIASESRTTVESLGIGNAGNIDISARLIDMNRGTISGTTTSGEGGNLTIYGNDIRLLNNSLISTTAGTADAPGNGGNITIVTITLVGLQNSDITANSFRGEGGQINITAQGIFGLEFRESLTSENDITAISLFNPNLNGEVNIQTPDIEPTRGLTDIPAIQNPEPIAKVCRSRATGSQELRLGGRGTPSGSGDALTGSDDGLIGAIAPVTSAGRPIAAANRQPVEKGERELLLAQDWYVNSEGQLILTETPIDAIELPAITSPRGCHG